MVVSRYTKSCLGMRDVVLGSAVHICQRCSDLGREELKKIACSRPRLRDCAQPGGDGGRQSQSVFSKVDHPERERERDNPSMIQMHRSEHSPEARREGGKQAGIDRRVVTV